MRKEEWCELHFGDVMPDCLPLPDKREDYVSEWQACSVTVKDCPDVPELAASIAFLLGVYGGIGEAGFLVRKKEGWLPLRLQWDKETSGAALADKAHEMMQEGDSFAWSKQEAWDVLGQEKGRGIAFSEIGDVPQEERDGFALIFQADSDGLRVNYATSCYTEGFIRVLAHSWQEIVLSFPKAALLSDVCITDAETRKMLDSFNQTVRDYDRKATVIDQFRACAAKKPDHVAVVYEERSYTYAEVDDLSD